MQTELSVLDRKVVNNAYYDTLGERWHQAMPEPVALLKSEGRLKNRWVLQTLFDRQLFDAPVLDIGCGSGFLTNELARFGFRVSGIDLSESSLEQARALDATKTVRYQRADAYELPFPNSSFEVITCFDFLEHVSMPQKVINEAARVLRPGGLFFYHTFNRHPIARLVVIKGLEWFVKGTPPNLHAYELFIRPEEMCEMMNRTGLSLVRERGIRPRLGLSFFKLLLTGRVGPHFDFVWSRSSLISYAGFARKNPFPRAV